MVTDDDKAHYVCSCEPNIGLCGVVLKPDEYLEEILAEVPEGVEKCSECDSLRDGLCPRCGRQLSG